VCGGSEVGGYVFVFCTSRADFADFAAFSFLTPQPTGKVLFLFFFSFFAGVWGSPSVKCVATCRWGPPSANVLAAPSFTFCFWRSALCVVCVVCVVVCVVCCVVVLSFFVGCETLLCVLIILVCFWFSQTNTQTNKSVGMRTSGSALHTCDACAAKIAKRDTVRRCVRCNYDKCVPCCGGRNLDFAKVPPPCPPPTRPANAIACVCVCACALCGACVSGCVSVCGCAVWCVCMWVASHIFLF